MSPHWSAFGHGALAMASAIAGVSFLKFWRISRDRFFLFFSGAFWVLGLNWTVLTLAQPADETRHLVYVIRLAAFVLILIAIVDKNRQRKAS